MSSGLLRKRLYSVFEFQMAPDPSRRQGEYVDSLTSIPQCAGFLKKLLVPAVLPCFLSLLLGALVIIKGQVQISLRVDHVFPEMYQA